MMLMEMIRRSNNSAWWRRELKRYRGQGKRNLCNALQVAGGEKPNNTLLDELSGMTWLKGRLGEQSKLSLAKHVTKTKNTGQLKSPRMAVCLYQVSLGSSFGLIRKGVCSSLCLFVFDRALLFD